MLFNTNIIINIIVKYHKFICRYEFIITREDSHEEKNVNIYFIVNKLFKENGDFSADD